MPSELLPLEHFSFIEPTQNVLTNRIAGKLINIKKIKLLSHKHMLLLAVENSIARWSRYQNSNQAL